MSQEVSGCSATVMDPDLDDLGDVTTSSEGCACGRQYCGVRYLLAVLISFGFFFAITARACINVAIVAMVNLTHLDPHKGGNWNVSDACPDDSSLNSTDYNTKSGEFDWDANVQSLILSVFFYGYIILPLPGAYVAERFGAKLVFGLSIFLPGVICLVTPLLARWSVTALIVSRFVAGLIQGPLYSANHTFWGRWAPPLERSRLMTITFSGSTIGDLASLGLTGYLCSTDFLGGWPSPFYIFGASSCVWFLLWMILSSSHPTNHHFISVKEKQYIIDSNPTTEQYVRPPWRKLLTSAPFYSVVLFTLFEGMGFYVVFTCVPMYVKQVLQYNIAEDGLLMSAPYLAHFLVGLLAGPAADFLLTKQYLSVTNTRKLFTFLGCGLNAVAIFAIALVDCDRVLAVVFLVIGWGVSGLLAAGPAVAIIDMSPEYAGTVMGICNPFSNVGGFLSPVIVAQITGGQPSRSDWQKVFYVTGAMFSVACLSFLLFGSSERQPWSCDHDQSHDHCHPINAGDETSDDAGDTICDDQQRLVNTEEH